MSGEALSVETLRALLDAAGLVGAGPVWTDANGMWVRLDDTGDWFIADTEHSRRTIRDRLSAWHGNAASRHDSAARVLGAPDLATARGLAAENAALRAEVARLRVVIVRVADTLDSSRRPALASRLRAALEAP